MLSLLALLSPRAAFSLGLTVDALASMEFARSSPLMLLALAAVACVCAFLFIGFLAGRKTAGTQMFCEFFGLRSDLVGSLTIRFQSQVFHFGNKCPLYRPIFMVVKNERFFAHVMTHGNLGLGEAFMWGWFELETVASERVPATQLLSLDEFKAVQAQSRGDIYDLISFFIINRIDKRARERPSWSLLFRLACSFLYHKLIGSRLLRHASNIHYNENPEMYRDMLGRTQAYTCGWVTAANSALPDDWRSGPLAPRSADQIKSTERLTLHQIADLCTASAQDKSASPPSEFMLHPLDSPFDLKLDVDGIQIAKFDRVCRKLQLRPGQRLLDIGCGYGCLSVHAAKHYGVHVIAFAASPQMVEGAIAHAKAEGVADKCRFFVAQIEVLQTLEDNSFDAIAAIGVFEHVLVKQRKMCFDRFQALLKHDGKILLHMLCSSEKPNRPDGFIQTYIFPLSRMNVPSELLEHFETRKFKVFDMEDIGQSYSYTLDCWWKNLQQHFAKHPDKYTSEYKKMFEYYLQSCKAECAHGGHSLMQILAFKNARTQLKPLHRYS